MSLINKARAIPGMQKYRYLWIILSSLLFLSPLLIIPSLFGNTDMCGKLCMRRFYLYFPGMDSNDLLLQIQVAIYGVIAMFLILVTTFFFGRIWCGFLCPMGGLPELISRIFPDRWKIEYRSLPQVPIRYGYFATYLVLMPMLGISACTLCNFITIPRLFESFSGGLMGIAFIFSSVGFVNLLLLFLLGFFANKGRAYCQFLCPIGAIDGVVNRMGSRFRFTHRIRVERERCSGCNVCARKCMTGAIKMVDKIAVVDQLSCMSCHECVDVCDWDAIKWTNAPNAKQPKRVKRDVEIHPLPMWTSVYHPHKQKKGLKKFNWGRIVASALFVAIVGGVSISQAFAKDRNSDPDGCLVCHALPDLTYIDQQGLMRNASINTNHYLSSLHGSIACTDCHQNLSFYPHQEENVSVDCAASCHLDEPSQGEAYSHKQVTEEFQQSVHNLGWSKGLTGGNRVTQNANASPSCQFCHSNTRYIPAHLELKFKDTFAHTETECGSCHQGEVWLNQFSGHILRRLIGGRWSKTDEVAMCNKCHDNPNRIDNTKRHQYTDTAGTISLELQPFIGDFANHYTQLSGAKLDHPALPSQEKTSSDAEEAYVSDERFNLASQSYAMTLHARLLNSGVDEGASCLECHAPTGFNHGIQSQYDPRSPTHKNNLTKTCASGNCHAFSEHPSNKGFVNTDLHAIDMLSWLNAAQALTPNSSLLTDLLASPWGIGGLLLASIFIITLTLNIATDKYRKNLKPNDGAFLGGSAFDRKILNITAKKAKRSTNKKQVKTKQNDPVKGQKGMQSIAPDTAKADTSLVGSVRENTVIENTAVENTAVENTLVDKKPSEAKRIAALAKAKAKAKLKANSQSLQTNHNQSSKKTSDNTATLAASSANRNAQHIKSSESNSSKESATDKTAMRHAAIAKAKAKKLAREAASKAAKETKDD